MHASDYAAWDNLSTVWDNPYAVWDIDYAIWDMTAQNEVIWGLFAEIVSFEEKHSIQ